MRLPRRDPLRELGLDDGGERAEGERLLERAVPPAAVAGIFGRIVLPVVDEEVRARDKSGMLQILTSNFAFAVSQYV